MRLVLCLAVVFASLGLSCESSAQVNKGITICLDPGHPSEVGMGTEGKHLTEVGFAWTMANLVKSRLERKGYRVVMTKTKERQLVKNVDRAKVANKSGAALMLRFHCDAAANERGYATFFAAKQGRHGGVVGPSQEVLKRVGPMARAFHKATIASLTGMLKDRGFRDDTKTAVGAKFGALIGSIHSNVPSILVEMAVLTNPKDEAIIRVKANQERLAEALIAGVEAAIAADPTRLAKR